jgi:C1A family cysteine protease
MTQLQVRTRRIQRYGWNRDLPDARDHRYAASPTVLKALPTAVDLRPSAPPVYNQGQLGSCTGNAIAGAVQFERMRQKLAAAGTTVPSRLFIYYNERVIEGTVAQDSGAQIRDGIKTVAKQGACFESGKRAWPYVASKFATKPLATCYAAAASDTTVQYSAVPQEAAQMKGCLAEGYPFVFGFTVYESFESPAVAASGIVPMPASGESVLGGHAVLAVGYNDATQQFIVRNSWGAAWGLDGYFLIPYAYLTDPNLASDFWTIRMVETPVVAR